MLNGQRHGRPQRPGFALCMGIGAVIAVAGFVAEPWTSFAQSGAASADEQNAAALETVWVGFGGVGHAR